MLFSSLFQFYTEDCAVFDTEIFMGYKSGKLFCNLLSTLHPVVDSGDAVVYCLQFLWWLLVLNPHEQVCVHLQMSPSTVHYDSTYSKASQFVWYIFRVMYMLIQNSTCLHCYTVLLTMLVAVLQFLQILLNGTVIIYVFHCIT